MSSLNLFLSMKALDLSLSQDDKDSEVVHVKNGKPTLNPRADSRSKNAEEESLRSPTITEQWDAFLLSTARNTESRALPPSQTLKNKWHPKHKKRKDLKSNAELTYHHQNYKT
jgi:hypothetical protein